MIGKTLQLILKEKKITVGELSRRTGVSDQTLYSIIRRNNMKVGFDVLLKVCAALDVRVERFYEEYLLEEGMSLPLREPPPLPDHLRTVLQAYEQQPSLQYAVDRILGLPEKSFGGREKPEEYGVS